MLRGIVLRTLYSTRQDMALHGVYIQVSMYVVAAVLEALSVLLNEWLADSPEGYATGIEFYA